jgi:hypothetical protein
MAPQVGRRKESYVAVLLIARHVVDFSSTNSSQNDGLKNKRPQTSSEFQISQSYGQKKPSQFE